VCKWICTIHTHIYCAYTWYRKVHISCGNKEDREGDRGGREKRDPSPTNCMAIIGPLLAAIENALEGRKGGRQK
jgi:hypothetical protein